MKYTKALNKKLDRIMPGEILRTRNLSKEIARLTGYSQGRISDIVQDRQHPTELFLTSMTAAMFSDADQRQALAVRARHQLEWVEK